MELIQIVVDPNRSRKIGGKIGRKIGKWGKTELNKDEDQWVTVVDNVRDV